MNLYERNKIKTSLVNFIYDWDKDFVKNLKDCSHCGENLSPHHTEDSVWTHILLVLQSSVFDSSSTIEDIVCAFVHDFGKPASRIIKFDEAKNINKITFYGHGQFGVQKAIDFMLDYQKVNSDLTNEMICRIISVVSNHIEFWNIQQAYGAFEFCNYDIQLLKTFCNLSKNDVLGSICTTEKDDLEKELLFVTQIESLFEVFQLEKRKEPATDQNIYFLCGVPGVGKDYIASTILETEIVSYDNIRREIFKSKNNFSRLSPSDIYSRAFDYCQKIELNSYLFAEIKELLKQNKDISICNTFVKSRGRKRVLNMLKNNLKQHRTHLFYIVQHSREIFKRNKIRESTDKIIPIHVINVFLSEQKIPSCVDGFYNVSVMIN